MSQCFNRECDNLKNYARQHETQLHRLLLQLARIPAPTGKEERRAQFCLEWLKAHGAEDACIDEAGNVVWLYQNGMKPEMETDKNKYKNKMMRPLIVFDAHMDVVFPDEEDLPLYEQDGRIYCPGVGDDTANLCVLLMMAAYAAQERPDTGERDLLFVCGVGEEGLGNLKGVREICRVFGERMEVFYALDLTMEAYTCRAVGSLRYQVEVDTAGGHSYHDFGNTNANAVLAELICALYRQPTAQRGETTYNVGTICGGTTVNSIAQHAELLYEVRSDDREDLQQMEQQFEKVLQGLCSEHVRVNITGTVQEKKSAEQVLSGREQADSDERMSGQDCRITVTQIGQRPCEGKVDSGKRSWLFAQVERITEEVFGIHPVGQPCSTDCNIPLSLNIPSVCLGVCRGAGAHTREEYVEADSLVQGLEIGLRVLGEVRQLYRGNIDLEEGKGRKGHQPVGGC